MWGTKKRSLYDDQHALYDFIAEICCMHYVGFLICIVVIFFAGQKLSYYGHELSDRLGIGKAWMGLIMMASVTSLPELMTGIGSVTIANSPDLAVGDVLGSCAFNLLILSLLDVFYVRSSILARVGSSHNLAASLSIVLLSLVGMGIFLPEETVLLGWIGVSSLGFMIVYLIAVRMIYRYEAIQHRKSEEHKSKQAEVHKRSTKRIVLYYVLNALVVVVTALFLPFFAEQIAMDTGLGEGFVGTLFLAASTSLPELAISFTAFKMGQLDMALGNLLGSNIFNIFILAIDDLVYTEGNLLKVVSDSHLISVMAVIIMTAVAIIGITYRKVDTKIILAWDSIVILLVYVLNLYLILGS